MLERLSGNQNVVSRLGESMQYHDIFVMNCIEDKKLYPENLYELSR